jgi:hypothetical protein
LRLNYRVGGPRGSISRWSIRAQSSNCPCAVLRAVLNNMRRCCVSLRPGHSSVWNVGRGLTFRGTTRRYSAARSISSRGSGKIKSTALGGAFLKGFSPEGNRFNACVYRRFAGLLATRGMAWAETCRVAQTSTLNVYGEPSGRIVGTLNEGTIYVVCDHSTASQMGEDCAAKGKDRLGAPQFSALRFLVNTSNWLSMPLLASVGVPPLLGLMRV